MNPYNRGPKRQTPILSLPPVAALHVERRWLPFQEITRYSVFDSKHLYG